MNEALLLEYYHNQLHLDTSLNDLAHTPGFAENTSCGDEIGFLVSVDSKTKIIHSIRYNGHACSMTLASAEYLARTYEGKEIPDAEDTIVATLLESFAITQDHRRITCVVLPVKAFWKAVVNRLTE